MRTSEQTDQITEALAKAQKDFPVIDKSHHASVPTKSGGEYGYDYADLEDTVTATRPVTTREGLAVSQWPEWDGENDLLTTRLSHTSGQWMEATMRLFLSATTPQAHGSAITYAKRYAYCAALGIVADKDDDGNAATREGGFQRRPSSSTGNNGTGRLVTEKQLGFLKQKAHGRGYVDDAPGLLQAAIGGQRPTWAELTTVEASKVIDHLIAMEKGGEYAPQDAELISDGERP